MLECLVLYTTRLFLPLTNKKLMDNINHILQKEENLPQEILITTSIFK